MCHNIRPIRNIHDYKSAVYAITSLWEEGKENSYEKDQLDVLSSLVEHHEQLEHPTQFPDPVEALKFHIDQQEISMNSLIEIFGSLEKVDEVIARKRQLNLNEIWHLCMLYKIPAESLIKPYQLT
ncbi:MAG: transcriptional regulator [Alphaproteobacteria bacterium]|nr:transcriptional regulator [Alphaproteobacteria bacterium]